MGRSFGFLALLSVLIVGCGVAASLGLLYSHHMPLSLQVVDARTAVVYPFAGSSLPAGLQAGDQIDLPALDLAARAALAVQNLQGTLPADQTYTFMLRKSAGNISVPVTTVFSGLSPRARFTQWVFLGNYAMFAFLALLTLWRGRGRAAVYTTAWLTFTMLGFLFNYGIAADGVAGMTLQCLALLCYILGRITFYLIMETLVGAALTPRARRIARSCFILVLAVGSATMLGGPIAFIMRGWAGLLPPVFGVLFTAGYIVPALVLFYAYGRSTEAQRPHLRWLVWSTLALLVGIFLSNTSIMDASTNLILQSIAMCLGIGGFSYTVLRHRVVDVSVVLDRTLVYGATTALVVGVVATMNSLALRATLGEGTSLLLQIVVPLALGIVLGKVRVYMDRTVEQVFFRSKYLAERALQDFARHCGHIENVQKLLQAAVTEIVRHTRSPGVAFYELAEDGYFCMRQAGTVAYPKRVDMDDRAMVAARAELKAVDLSDYPGELGTDGCVFPMIVLGVLRGVLVCANRPGERFGSDEKQLLSQVASDVGAAWRILRARDNEDLVRALAKGTLKPAAARARAQALEATWIGQPLSV